MTAVLGDCISSRSSIAAGDPRSPRDARDSNQEQREREQHGRLAILPFGPVEPRIKKLEPVLDHAVARRRTVAQEGQPIPGLGRPRQGRVPAESLPVAQRAGWQHDVDAVLARLKALVTAHPERREHEALQGRHDPLGRLSDLFRELVAACDAPGQVVQIHVPALGAPIGDGSLAQLQNDVSGAGLRQFDAEDVNRFLHSRDAL